MDTEHVDQELDRLPGRRQAYWLSLMPIENKVNGYEWSVMICRRRDDKEAGKAIAKTLTLAFDGAMENTLSRLGRS